MGTSSRLESRSTQALSTHHTLDPIHNCFKNMKSKPVLAPLSKSNLRLRPFPRLALIACTSIYCVSTCLAQSAATSQSSSSASVIFSNGSSLKLRTKSGDFPLVAVGAGESVNVQLPFDNTSSSPFVLQALDGGTATQTNANGTMSIQFQAASQPGLYRVSVRAGNATSIFRFWVTDPQNPSSNAAALKP